MCVCAKYIYIYIKSSTIKITQEQSRNLAVEIIIIHQSPSGPSVQPLGSSGSAGIPRLAGHHGSRFRTEGRCCDIKLKK